MTFDSDRYMHEVLTLGHERHYAELAQLPSVASATPAQHRDAFAALLARKIEPLRGWVIPPEVSTAHAADLGRIANDLTTQPDTYYTARNDMMVKDLALVVGLLVGTRVCVFAKSGVPRSWALRGGARGWLGNIATFIAARGFNGFIEIHMHERSQRLTANTWKQSIAMAAQLMSRNPAIRGLMGSSWFFDPKLPSISPHLSYLYAFPSAGGARFFDLGTSAQAVALATTASKARRALYDEGKYLPVHVGFVWLSRKLMAWSAREATTA